MVGVHFLIIFVFTLVGAVGFATPSGFTLQGRLAKDGVAITGSTTVAVSVTSPNTDQCLLYQETHNLNLASESKGSFSLVIGGGTRTSQDKGLSLSEVFTNAGSTLSGLSCQGSATSYLPGGSDSRYVFVSFTTPQGVVAFNEPYVVRSVPYAFDAMSLAGRGAGGYLQTTATTTQSKLDDVLQPSNYTELLALLNGTSSKYMTSSNTGPAKLPVLSSTPSTPAAGQIWYEGGSLKYYDHIGTQVRTLGTLSDFV